MGLVSAILIHWATNYFVFSYVYMIADFAEISVEQAFEHTLMITFEILFIALGILSIAIMIFNRYNFRDLIVVLLILIKNKFKTN